METSSNPARWENKLSSRPDGCEVEDGDSVSDELTMALKHLHRLVFDRVPPALPRELSSNSSLVELHDALLSIRDGVAHFAEGDLSCSIHGRGAIAGGLKSLQANLRHLTWQVRQVEQEDFSQRVIFMGEFAEAFNGMVQRLERTLTALEESRTRFQELASHDALTGTLNRLMFMGDAERLMTEAREQSLPFSLIMLDIDRFKLVNDTYGHLTGDAILQYAAQRVRRGLRDGDGIYRYGGEEFVILLRDASQAEAEDIAERLRRSLEENPFMWNGASIPVTASFGVSTLLPDADEEFSLCAVVKQADDNLYRAKSLGRNLVVCSVCTTSVPSHEGDSEDGPAL